MAWGDTYTYEGVIEGHTQKAIRFSAHHWADFEWVPRTTKKGDPIIEIISHDHDSKEATVQIAAWIVDKNGWPKP